MKKILSLQVLLFLLLAGKSYGQWESRPIKGCSTIEASVSSGQTEATAFCNNCNYWAGGIVPFTFDANVSQNEQDAMLDAMATIESISMVDFVPYSGSGSYLNIRDDNGNSSSSIGMSGGETTIRIFNWNVEMIMIHELLHALGFWHEQSRPDRNSYIQVNYGNICTGYSSQFDVQNTGVTPNIPYDFESIMHYEPFAFSTCADPDENCENWCTFFLGPTIEVLPQYEEWANLLGQRINLSYSDSLMMSFTYPFSSYRFFNQSYTGNNFAGTHIYKPYKDFTPAVYGSSGIPNNAAVWIMPGDYPNAEGVYSKPSVIRAPYGGVILK